MNDFEREMMFEMLDTMERECESKSLDLEEHQRKYARASGAIFILWTSNIITNEEREELSKKLSEYSLKGIKKTLGKE